MPSAVYTYLYIRKPDEHKEAGDIDFVLNAKEYSELKNSLLRGEEIKGVKIWDRSGFDLIKLFDPNIDVLSFIGTKNMAENVRARSSAEIVVRENIPASRPNRQATNKSC